MRFRSGGSQGFESWALIEIGVVAPVLAEIQTVKTVEMLLDGASDAGVVNRGDGLRQAARSVDHDAVLHHQPCNVGQTDTLFIAKPENLITDSKAYFRTATRFRRKVTQIRGRVTDVFVQ